MKWIKVAIGAVIAVLSIGIIATTVYKMTQETTREEVVTFEVLTETTVTTGTYNKLLKYSVYDIEENNYLVNNVVTIKVNNNDFEGMFHYVPESDSPSGLDGFRIYDIIDDDNFEISNDDSIELMANRIGVGDIVEITFEVTQPPQLTGINATLILLIPLVFVGGLLLYFYKPLKKD